MPKTLVRSRQISPSGLALTDAATITIDSDLGNIFSLASLSQPSTFVNPTGTPTDAQTLLIRIVSSAVRLISFGTAYVGASGQVLPSVTTGGGAEDTIGFRYSSAISKWVMTGTTLGFPSSATSLLDGITATRGSVIFRGATVWSGLPPAGVNTALFSNGVGTDPTFRQALTEGQTLARRAAL
jgi:hypothetical protein